MAVWVVLSVIATVVATLVGRWMARAPLVPAALVATSALLGGIALIVGSPLASWTVTGICLVAIGLSYGGTLWGRLGLRAPRRAAASRARRRAGRPRAAPGSPE